MKTGHVYWIHLPTHTNPKLEGYIGITSNLSKRWQVHKHNAKKCKIDTPHLSNAITLYGDSIIWESIFIGPYEGCMQLEEYFRPTSHIGWNISVGGAKPPMTNRTHTTETKAKMRKPKSVTWQRTSAIDIKIKNQRKAVYCVELGITFESAQDAAKYIGLKCAGNITLACSNSKTTAKGYHWQYANNSS